MIPPRNAPAPASALLPDGSTKTPKKRTEPRSEALSALQARLDTRCITWPHRHEGEPRCTACEGCVAQGLMDALAEGSIRTEYALLDTSGNPVTISDHAYRPETHASLTHAMRTRVEGPWHAQPRTGDRR